jgi:hypothetical protein
MLGVLLLPCVSRALVHYAFSLRPPQRNVAICHFPFAFGRQAKVSFNLSAFRRTEQWERFSDFAIDCALIPSPGSYQQKVRPEPQLRGPPGGPSHKWFQGTQRNIFPQEPTIKIRLVSRVTVSPRCAVARHGSRLTAPQAQRRGRAPKSTPPHLKRLGDILLGQPSPQRRPCRP